MSFVFRKDVPCLLVLAALAALLYLPHLGSHGLLDPDEPFYSLTAKEMLQRGDPSTPVMFGEPQFEKPIFVYWVLYASFKYLGVNEFSARIGMVVAGIATVLVTYLWGLALFRRRIIAFMGAAMLATSVEFIVLSRTVLTDIFLGLFVTAALTCYSWGYRWPERRSVAWHGVFLFCALGFLVKGPLGLLLPFLGIMTSAVVGGETRELKRLPWISGFVIFLAVAVPWFWMMTERFGVPFLRQTFLHENMRRFFVAEHSSSDKPYYYFIALAGGLYPWTLFVPAAVGFFLREGFKTKRQVFLFPAAVLVSAFFFFTFAKSKLMSYIFPVFPAISVMGAVWLYRFWRASRRGAAPSRALSLFALLLLGLLPAAAPPVLFFLGRHEKIEIPGLILLTGIVWIPFAWTGLFLLWKKRVNAAFVCIFSMMLALQVVVIGPLLHATEAAFSSRRSTEFYKKVESQHRTRFVLASKLFVRGVSYYCDATRVGVLSMNKNAFYTPHPIPMVSSADELSGLPPEYFPLFCFVRDKELRFLRTISEGRFVVEVLHDEAERSLVRVSKQGAP